MTFSKCEYTEFCKNKNCDKLSKDDKRFKKADMAERAAKYEIDYLIHSSNLYLQKDTGMRTHAEPHILDHHPLNAVFYFCPTHHPEQHLHGESQHLHFNSSNVLDDHPLLALEWQGPALGDLRMKLETLTIGGLDAVANDDAYIPYEDGANQQPKNQETS